MIAIVNCKNYGNRRDVKFLMEKKDGRYNTREYVHLSDVKWVAKTVIEDEVSFIEKEIGVVEDVFEGLWFVFEDWSVRPIIGSKPN